MNIVLNIILAVQMLSAVAMIGLILVQHGKGADMGAAFGSGGSGSLFGASGSANFLSRTTAVLATVFFVATSCWPTLATCVLRARAASLKVQPLLFQPGLRHPQLPRLCPPFLPLVRLKFHPSKSPLFGCALEIIKPFFRVNSRATGEQKPQGSSRNPV